MSLTLVVAITFLGLLMAACCLFYGIYKKNLDPIDGIIIVYGFGGGLGLAALPWLLILSL